MAGPRASPPAVAPGIAQRQRCPDLAALNPVEIPKPGLYGVAMTERHINPILKIVLEIGPIAVFFLAYRWAPVPEGLGTSERQLEQILFSTKVFIPTILASLAASWAITRKLPKMAVITAVVVIIFGGLTLILRDDTFVKMKPTILYTLFASILGFGMLRGQSYLRYLMDELIPMQQEGWMKFTTRFIVFYILLAVANEIVWRVWGTDVWVNFRTFVLPAANFLFIMAQLPLFQRYALAEEPKAES
jgi:intracellular septation protein